MTDLLATNNATMRKIGEIIQEKLRSFIGSLTVPMLADGGSSGNGRAA